MMLLYRSGNVTLILSLWQQDNHFLCLGLGLSKARVLEITEWHYDSHAKSKTQSEAGVYVLPCIAIKFEALQT